LIRAAIAARACVLAANVRSGRSSHSGVECQDQVTALPGAGPARRLSDARPVAGLAAGARPGMDQQTSRITTEHASSLVSHLT
jgi:hypothetical protein